MSHLIHTLGKISFAEIPNDQFVGIKNELHQLVRKDYPIFESKAQQFISIELAANVVVEPQKNTEQQYQFTSEDKHWGVIVNTKNIILHTDKYVNFELFSQKLEYILRLVDELVDITHTFSIGIRYFNQLNSIDENDGFSFAIKRAEILQPVLNCQPYIAGNRMRSVYENDDGLLVFQSGIVVKGLLLPTEYFTLLNQLGRRPEPITDVCGYVDIDSFFHFPKPEVFEVNEILAKMDKLRQQAKAVYAEVVGDIGVDGNEN